MGVCLNGMCHQFCKSNNGLPGFVGEKKDIMVVHDVVRVFVLMNFIVYG